MRVDRGQYDQCGDPYLLGFESQGEFPSLDAAIEHYMPRIALIKYPDEAIELFRGGWAEAIRVQCDHQWGNGSVAGCVKCGESR